MTLTNAKEPRLLRVAANGIELAVFEWNAELRGEHPTIVLAHATGFHARCWDQVVRRLGRRHILAVDQRGHGRSDKIPFESWVDFGRDLLELLTKLELRDSVGVGHSMGGHAMVAAAARQPRLFRRLVLIDPVIMAPEYYSEEIAASAARLAADHPSARRRKGFDSIEAIVERLSGREPFSFFVPQAFDDYCRHGLLPAADGEGFELACPPEFEASIYTSAASNPGIYDDAARIGQPVTLVRAMQPRTPTDILNFAYSPTWSELASVFPDATDHLLAEHTHFIPMQDPDRAARLILDAEDG